MQLSIYHDIINKVTNVECPGYGYLEVFANALYSHRKELNIGNVLLFLKLEVNNNSTEFHYFVDNRKINTDCFKLVDIASQDEVVDSERVNIMPLRKRMN